MTSLHREMLFLQVVTVFLSGHLAHGSFFPEIQPFESFKIKVPFDLWEQVINPFHLKPKEAVQDEIINELNFEKVNDIINPIGHIVVDPTTVVKESSLTEDNPGGFQNNDSSTTEGVDKNVTTGIALDAETSGTEINPLIAGQVIQFPCSCENGQCGCCSKMILPKLPVNICANLSFIPEDFMIDVKLNVNGLIVIHKRVTASDPPPICVNPANLPLQICAEISNIRVRNKNAFACLKIKVSIVSYLLYATPFKCFGLGPSGLQQDLKPQPILSIFGPEPINIFGTGSRTADDDDGGGIIGKTLNAILNSKIGGKSSTEAAPNFFGITAATTAPPAVGLFGLPIETTAAPVPAGLFGITSAPPDPAPMGLFGATAAPAATAPVGLFGVTATTAAPVGLFGAPLPTPVAKDATQAPGFFGKK